MNVVHRLHRLAARPHLPRRTVRLRLTLLYGALFLASGVALLAITYGLAREATDGVYVYHGPNGVTGAVVERPGNSSRPPAVASGQINDGTNPPESLSPGQAKAQAARLETLAKQQHEDQLHELLGQSAIALGIMTIVSLVLGWFIAGRVLRPIRTITRSAREISATNLHERLALHGPDDELKELGDTIDELLARLEGAFDAQRQFVANASHELRTPLARQRTVAQVALADPEATLESLRAAHERVIAAGQQQERLIDALLTLTRGHAGLARREPFDLAAITETVVRDRRTEARARGVDPRTTLEPAPVSGDPRLAEQLVANLVDNALRHNHQGGRVEIATVAGNRGSVLSIVNDGPWIAPGEVARLFEPLQRLNATRGSQPDGFGLGLSIVQAIADAHDASIVTRARAEGGLDIEVRFEGLVTDAALGEVVIVDTSRRGEHVIAVAR